MKTLRNFLKYHFGGSNSQVTYAQMRKDYIESKYDIVNKVCKVNGLLNPKYKIQESQGILGTLKNAEVSDICKHIQKDGYFIFPNLASKELVEDLKNFASHTPIHYLIPAEKSIAYSKESVKYAESKNLSNRYQIFNISDLKNNEVSLKLATDANFLHIANNYLGAKPILDLIVFWWSNSFKTLQVDETTKNLLKSGSAQMFHFDMDRLKFLKFFVYLTDVDTTTGPHVFVKGTHNKIPCYIHKDGRYTDEQVSEHDAKNIIEINGKAGSIIAVDTRGLHKGKELEQGERLIFQIEFANSLFGNPQMPIVPEKLDYKGNSTYFDTYKLFFKK